MTSDWECLESARRGDESAWRSLFQRHYASLTRTAFLITGSMDTAKDLAQETFLKLFKSGANRYQGNFHAYLSTIVYRMALKEKKRHRLDQNLEVSEIADETPQALTLTMQEERNRHLARVIQSLPEHHREVLVLRFYRNHQYEEIAKIVDLPVGTVKSRIFYAVKSCREKLQEVGEL
jgi:RNA polymerase sigma-70 factor, ECF subfamily